MPDKPDPALGWKFVEKVLREGDVERLDQESDEEVERQLRAAGIELERVPTADEIFERGVERARKRDRERGQEGAGAARVAVLAVRSRRGAWIPWLVAAAIGACLVALVVERREVVAWWRHEPEPIGPDLQEVAPKPPTPQEHATALRDEAFAACGDGRWALCNRKLDEARQLDPGGESDARVEGARKAVYDGLHPDGGGKRGLK